MTDALGHWAASWWGLPRRIWDAVRDESDRDAAASGPLDLSLFGDGTPIFGIVVVVLVILAVAPWAAVGVVISIVGLVTRPARRRFRRDAR